VIPIDPHKALSDRSFCTSSG
jgi:hypothetical protein